MKQIYGRKIKQYSVVLLVVLLMMAASFPCAAEEEAEEKILRVAYPTTEGI